MAEPAKNAETIHEAVGVFNDADSLLAAIDDLQEHGFMRQEISVLADENAIEEKLGHIYKRVEEAEDDPAAPRTIFVPNETLGEAEGTAPTTCMSMKFRFTDKVYRSASGKKV